MYYSPKTSADGLVFHYDTGNTVRSYLGEPTTNLVPYSEYQYLADGYTEALPGWDTHEGTMLIDVSNKVPGFTNRSIKLTCIQANVYKQHFSVPLTNGQTYTVSFWAKAQVAGSYGNFFLGDGPGGYLVVVPGDTVLTTEFTRFEYTFSMTARDTGTYNFATYLYGDGQIGWLSGFQIENKNHVTQYLPSNGAATTRSATQGLKDLTAKNTINISTVSFDSNAQMTFDGTDDFGQTGAFVPGITSKSYEAVTRLYNVNQQAGGVIGMMGENGEPFDTIVYNETGAGWGFGSTGFARTAWSNVLETTTNFLHLVATYVDYSYKLYRNGQLILTTTSYPILNYNFNSVIIFGKRHAATTGPYNGEIPIAKVYNRALSADEVQRNFNAVKSRFNIA